MLKNQIFVLIFTLHFEDRTSLLGGGGGGGGGGEGGWWWRGIPLPAYRAMLAVQKVVNAVNQSVDQN